MARRNATRLNLILFVVITTLSVLASTAWLIYRYPWPIFLGDFSSARESTFVSNWPLPALEEERQERKKLKRFPRAEQQRRLGVIMRRMDYLSIPIFDFFLDSGVQYSAPELSAGVSVAPSLIWPSFSTRRTMGSDDAASKDIKYLVMPTASGVQCLEGITMHAGEELRVNLPVSSNKRNVVFTVLPIVPSHLRAWLGQYSWARQYNDADVNRLQTVTIPVNDPAANVLRLSLGTGNLLLTSASISQWDRSGRLPVQHGQLSQVWRDVTKRGEISSEAGSLTSEQGPDESAAVEDAQPQIGVSATATAGYLAQSSQSLGGQSPNAPLSSTAAGSELKVGKTNEPSRKELNEQNDQKPKNSISMDELLDPSSVKYNPILAVQGSRTVAIGYNALLIQLDPLVNSIISDEKLFSTLAPNLYAFMSQSLTAPVTLPKFERGSDLFQHTIARQFADQIPVQLPILTKELISGRNVFNLYQEFRNFGYKVVSFAPPEALAYPEVLAQGYEVPKVEGRWLDGNDWRFVARRRQLDQQNLPASGLEAIFKSDSSNDASSLSEGDFQKMGLLLEGLERNFDSIPDWRANEISVVSSNSHYLPRLIDSFQRWTKDNTQIRFFGHMYLQNDDQSMRPSFKDFLQVFKLRKFRSLALPGTTETYARIVMLDRVFGSMIDTLVARRIFHRSVVSVLLPGPGKNKSLGEFDGHFLISVPGLNGQQPNPIKVHSFDDLLATMAQVVGVQFNKHDFQGRLLFKGESLDVDKALPSANPVVKQKISTAISEHQQKSEGIAGDAVSGKETSVDASSVHRTSVLESAEALGKPLQVSKYRMIVLPRAAGCQPFEWITSGPYYGLAASQPIVEEPAPRGRVIRVYPCVLRDQVIELSWFQNHEGPEKGGVASENAANWLGGSLHLGDLGSATDPQDFPFFLIGPQALSLDSLPMRLEMFMPSEIPQIFDIETKRGIERETLARVLNLNTQMQSAQIAARTLVYFFREPVRR